MANAARLPPSPLIDRWMVVDGRGLSAFHALPAPLPSTFPGTANSGSAASHPGDRARQTGQASQPPGR